MLTVDGSMLEGGGQLLRMAIAYSGVTGEEIRLHSIRGKRPKPGLRPQHIAAVRAVASLTGAQVRGLYPGSLELEFRPGLIKGGNYKIDVSTAGSIGLILQSVAPVATFAPKSVLVNLRGGTSVLWSVPTIALKHVVWRLLARMDFKGQLEIQKEGYYPRGGGMVRATFKPINGLKPIILDNRGDIKVVKGISVCGRLPQHVALRQARSAEEILKEGGYNEIDIVTEHHTGAKAPISPGSAIVLWAETSNGCLIEADSIGRRGKPAEEVGREAAEKLIQQLEGKAAVDQHTADNLIVWASLADGQSRLRVSQLTMHAATAIELAKEILGSHFRVEGEMGGPAFVVCEGIGWKPTKMETTKTLSE